jgi:hypothetical protein
MRRTLVRMSLAPVLWAVATAWNVGVFDRRAEILRRQEPTFVVLPRPEIVRALSFGFRSVLSDLYWIGAVNYFGDQRNARLGYAELSNYLEIVIGLDPAFESAYAFGGFALPWNTGKQWVNIDPAISLLEKGVQRFPSNWKMRLQLAWLYSSYRNRFKDAGDQLAVAARLAEAPPYLGPLSARMYATTGDYDGALLITEQLINESGDDEVRQALIRRAQEIRTVKDISELEKGVKRFEETQHRLPQSLRELVDVGLLRSVPEESLGGVFLYDPATGKVQSSVLHDRLKVFGQP